MWKTSTAQTCPALMLSRCYFLFLLSVEELIDYRFHWETQPFSTLHRHSLLKTFAVSYFIALLFLFRPFK